MEDRRKLVGQRIKQSRRLAKYRSQEAFAKAVGYNETTVGNAERGSDRVGDSVYEAIEAVLGWPIGSSTAYIAGTGPAPWETDAAAATAPVTTDDATDPADDWTSEEVERTRGMTADEITAEGRMIGRFSGEEAQLRYLRKAADIKLQKPVTPPA